MLWLGAIVFFAGPALTANDTGKFRLDASSFRLVNDIGYEFWVAAVVVGALVVWAISAVALRTALLPRWFGWLGIVVGIIQLFAIFFIPAFVYWGWILVTAGLLARKAGSPGHDIRDPGVIAADDSTAGTCSRMATEPDCAAGTLNRRHRDQPLRSQPRGDRLQQPGTHARVPGSPSSTR